MASYGGSPSVHFKTMFNPAFANFMETNPSMACSYEYVYNQGSSAYSCESPENNMPSCLYAAAAASRNSPVYGSPCMMTPLSPYLSISPASSGGGAHANDNDGVMREVDAVSPSCRRRLNFSSGASVLELALEAPVAVAKRNERERNRVKLINMTFQKLRQHLPLMTVGSKGKSRKLSKVQTLRSAIDYIRELQLKVHKHQQERLQQQQQPQQQPGHLHHQGGHKDVHEEFLKLNACIYTSEDDDIEDEEEMPEENEMAFEDYSLLQVKAEKCNGIDGGYMNIGSASHHMHRYGRTNDTNNNLSSSNNNNNNSDAASEACPSILSFGDEIKFLSEAQLFASGNNSV